ncbi:TPA: class I tRNA ligase family protein, partial [Listeria monocytogenes]
QDFKDLGLFIKQEPHLHSVGHSERTGAVVEPYLSLQWFVKMEPLAAEALELQKTENKVNFVPARFEKTYETWMDNIHDWCISRQLWWGHRIPAWYHKETGEIYVGESEPENLSEWEQDEDVLDTWFSSALWPFSTMGWPDTENPDFQHFFPTNTLVTGYDIIFFWVSRMIFQSVEFTGERPFKDTLIHGLVRDSEGRKMSKSLGNGVDPIEVIDKYGADSLRYTLATGSSPGQDLKFSY